MLSEGDTSTKSHGVTKILGSLLMSACQPIISDKGLTRQQGPMYFLFIGRSQPIDGDMDKIGHRSTMQCGSGQTLTVSLAG